jgi:cysteine-S-conjugate beta-lyase
MPSAVIQPGSVSALRIWSSRSRNTTKKTSEMSHNNRKSGTHAPRAEGSSFQTATTLVMAGRHPELYHGFVNPPVYHGSTVLYPDVAALEARDMPYTYGRRGTPTSAALEEALTALEGGAGTVLVPSGLAAVAMALQTVLKSADHLLMSDSCYHPTRIFCDTWLTRFGIETEYYDPCIGSEISRLFRENTAGLFLESPGSQTFGMQDVPAMTKAAKAAGVTTVMDNTWATALYFRPLDHGVDVSLQACTKYVGGHSDIMLGAVTANERLWPSLRHLWEVSGSCAGPDVVNLAHRGLRTMSVRLARHMQSGLEIARWLETRPEVDRVLHPALESHPGHTLWKRDFSGASGLFSVVMRPGPKAALAAFLDHLKLFGLGFSWGGYESLAVPFDPRGYRTATKWNSDNPSIRFHIGLEDTADLISDIEAGLKRWRDAGGSA